MDIEKEITELKEKQKDIIKVQEKLVAVQRQFLDTSQVMSGGQRKIIGLVKEGDKSITRTNNTIVEILRIIKSLMFIINILIWKVFLWEPLKKLLSLMFNNFMLLSETYKVLILGLIGTFFAGLLANLSANYIKAKFISKK